MTSSFGIARVVLDVALAVATAAAGCQDAGPATGVTGRAVSCAGGGSCPAGGECVGGWCMPSCASAADCPAGTCVAGACDFAPRPWECASAADCPSGAACIDAACVAGSTCVPSLEVVNGVDDDCDGAIDEVACPCPAGLVCCLGLCFDLANDAANCGACGARCMPGEHCEVGVCGVIPCATGAECASGICLEGWCHDDPGPCVPTGPEECNWLDDDCDGLVDEDVTCECDPGLTLCRDFGCVDTSSDPLHCGACSVTCGAGEVCAEGVCGA